MQGSDGSRSSFGLVRRPAVDGMKSVGSVYGQLGAAALVRARQ